MTIKYFSFFLFLEVSLSNKYCALVGNKTLVSKKKSLEWGFDSEVNIFKNTITNFGDFTSQDKFVDNEKNKILEKVNIFIVFYFLDVIISALCPVYAYARGEH